MNDLEKEKSPQELQALERQNIDDYAKTIESPINYNLSLTPAEHAIAGSGFTQFKWKLNPNYPLTLARGDSLEDINKARIQDGVETKRSFWFSFKTTSHGRIEVKLELLPLDIDTAKSLEPMQTYKIVQAENIESNEIELMPELRTEIQQEIARRIKDNMEREME